MEALHGRVVVGDRAICGGPQFQVRRRGRGGDGREDAIGIAGAHAHRAVDEVSQVVGQVRVVAPHEAAQRDVCIPIERDLTQDHVAHTVDAKQGHRILGADHVPAGLAHFLATQGHEAVREHLARER